MQEQELDSFIIESGRRKIVLVKKAGHHAKPFECQVWSRRASASGAHDFQWVLLSTHEYISEEAARMDFEMRRPQMHIEEGEVPMQRGKRLVQEMLREKLR